MSLKGSRKKPAVGLMSGFTGFLCNGTLTAPSRHLLPQFAIVRNPLRPLNPFACCTLPKLSERRCSAWRWKVPDPQKRDFCGDSQVGTLHSARSNFVFILSMHIANP